MFENTSGSEYMPSSHSSENNSVNSVTNIVSAKNKIDEINTEYEKGSSKNLNSSCFPRISLLEGNNRNLREPATATEKDLCPFCFQEIGDHFSRHLFRHHSDEEAVKKILEMPVKNNDRRTAIVLLRRKGNFILQKEKNIMNPVRKPPKVFTKIADTNSQNSVNLENYSPCVKCLGLFKNNYLWRHRKICKSNAERHDKKISKINHLSESQTFLVATGLLGNFLNKSRLLGIFKVMRADQVGFVAKSDVLICLYGESLLGKHKRQQMNVVVSQKMREMAKLKIALQNSTTISTLMDALKPEMYEYFLAATKVIAGYDADKLTFRAPSLASNMGTHLKFLCEIAKKAVITKNPLLENLNNPIGKRNEISELHEMINSHWCNDISSLANKVLTEKKNIKPKLLPMTEDVRAFNNYTLSLAKQAYNNLINNENLAENYRTLAQCTLALLLVFNRKRIGEVHFLEIETYEKTFSSTYQKEILSCLTKFEKTMSNTFKRVIVFGKGSKPVPILFTNQLQKFTNLLIKIRKSTDIVPKSNKYLFASPGSQRWMSGSSVVRKLALTCGAKHPELLSSTRFRKQIATILQLMNFEKDEMHQIAKFMGHTEKTHMDFYRLTEDVYQTAKVAKVLLLLNAGKGCEFKGKSLGEIEVLEEELYCDDIDPEEKNIDERQETGPSGSSTDEPILVPTAIHPNEKIEQFKKTNKVKKIDSTKRRNLKWLPEQKKIILNYFSENIRKYIAPKKEDCLRCARTYPQLFKETDWV